MFNFIVQRDIVTMTNKESDSDSKNIPKTFLKNRDVLLQRSQNTKHLKCSF